MTKDDGMKLLWFLVPLLVLIGIGWFTLWKLWSAAEPTVQKPVEPTPIQLVATRELESFTKLKRADLKLSSGTPESAGPSVPTVEELEGRYLLVKVDDGGEVKREMVAPREASPLLSDAVAVGIQPTSITSIGGQLQVGDIVDVVPSGTNQSREPFENVMVLKVVNDAKAGDKGSGIPVGITLAIPRASRDRFAAAAANAGIVVTRKILVAN
jgi:Flp pilus assembly protein CpaB